MTRELDYRYDNPFCVLWGVQAPNAEGLNPKQREQLKVITDKVEAKITEGYKETLEQTSQNIFELNKRNKALTVSLDNQEESSIHIDSSPRRDISKVATETHQDGGQ